MNTNLILCAAILVPSLTFCQSKSNDYLPFGKVDKTEFQKKQCDFDKEAEAEVLSDVGEFDVQFMAGNLTQQLSHHKRIKILNTKGFDKASIRIRYMHYRNSEHITHLSAVTYNLDEQGNVVTTNVEKSQIYDKKVTSRFSEITFTFPQLKPGSIIEYKYKIEGAGMRDWCLQDDIPVRFSKYTINFPGIFEVHMRPVCSLPYNSKDKSEYGKTIKEVTMKNIPALRDEEFITCKADYFQKVESWVLAYTWEGIRHPLLKSWDKVVDELYEDEDFGKQLTKNIPRTAELDEALKLITDPVQKMKTIHNYVRKNMSWDGNDNMWALDGVKSAWKEKKGTSGEINLILVNLLKDAGLNANPLLVSTREHGTLVTLWPNISQFNKVVACITIGTKQYYLDGTDMYTPQDMIPGDMLYTEGLLLDKREPYRFKWQEILDSTAIESNTVVLRGELTENGSMNGTATIKSDKYARTKRVAVLNSGLETYTDKILKKTNPSIGVDSVQIEDRENDSLALTQKFHFTAPINTSGEYSYFSANFFTGMESNPFIADTRFSDVFFGTCQKHTIIGYFKLPDGYTLEEVPKNLRLTLADKSLTITRQAAFANNALMTRTTIEYRRPFYGVDEYPDLREFYKKMYALLDEQFIMHKTATAGK